MYCERCIFYNTNMYKIVIINKCSVISVQSISVNLAWRTNTLASWIINFQSSNFEEYSIWSIMLWSSVEVLCDFKVLDVYIIYSLVPYYVCLHYPPSAWNMTCVTFQLPFSYREICQIYISYQCFSLLTIFHRISPEQYAIGS